MLFMADYSDLSNLREPGDSTWALSDPRLSSKGDAPETVGPYAVDFELGHGGMGEVYLAHDGHLRRNVALKRIRPDRRHEQQSVRRFELEARVTARLQHPSIIPVYHFARAGEDLYYTMRPVEGVSLRDLLSKLRDPNSEGREEWTAPRMVRLFLQAANAIAFAHSRGVVHRDLKPANIMIGTFEEVLVLDWGMAKIVRAEDIPATTSANPAESLGELTDTVEGAVIGTPGYMAPEQWRGEDATYGSDIFALGIILYEILALREPWPATDSEGRLEALREPPPDPSRLQPGRSIPANLVRVVRKALAFEPEDRYESVAEFSREVSAALEGKAAWRRDEAARQIDSWAIIAGKSSQGPDEIVLRSGGPGGRFRYACLPRLSENLRIEFDFALRKGSHSLSIIFDTREARHDNQTPNYCLEVLGGRRRWLSLLRAGRIVTGARSPTYQPKADYRCIVTREDDRFSLSIDGNEIYVYHDPIPLLGGFLVLSGASNGLPLRDLRVYSRGASARVSCLAVPDAFYNRALYDDARAEYERIAASHPGRFEGRVAGFRAGLCLLEMGRDEEDIELQSLYLAEAKDVFERRDAMTETCLAPLGLAMVAAESGDPVGKRQALERALAHHPHDPHLSAVHEWLLGRLHGLDPEDRRTLSELLPLAIGHCMRNDWERRVVRDLVHEARRSWEVPSFMTGRGRFREGEPVSHAEHKLFFAFWAGHIDLIERSLEQLMAAGKPQVYHFEDAILSALELGEPERARAMLEVADDFPASVSRRRLETAKRLCSISVLAVEGDTDKAEQLLAAVPPDPADRAFNSARFYLAQAFSNEGRPAKSVRILRRVSGNDSFAREQQVWHLLVSGEPDRAARELEPFLRRNDHASGRNLANFLVGCLAMLRGERDQAIETFAALKPMRWPRTWTLGSYYASGRLGDGDLSVYLDEALPWERRNLVSHMRLLESVGWETAADATLVGGR